MHNIIIEILEELENIDRRDVLKESVESRLNKTLKLYSDSINKSFRELLTYDYSAIVRNMAQKERRTTHV